MDFSLLKEVIENIRSVKIAVVGDFCLNACFFSYDSDSEISDRTGLPTRPVREQSYSLGGAGNLANNIISLRVKEVGAFGVVGNDLFGREMLRLMDDSSIGIAGMLTQEKKWSTHGYCKLYVDDQELNRFDFGNFNSLSDETADQLMEILDEQIYAFNVIIIYQQVFSGIHTDYMQQKLSGLISRNPEKIFISDIRDKRRSYNGTCMKLNDVEAALLSGIRSGPDIPATYDEAVRAAETLFERSGKPVFVTCGSRGSIAVDSSGIVKVPGLVHLGRVDLSGAGQGYLAGVSAAMAAGYSAGVSAQIGSFAAGVTVNKLFREGTVTPAEILEIGKDADYIYEPGLAEDIRQAVYLDNTEIEVINQWPEDVRISHAIFDHDGTISTLREGWEQIMAPVMIRAILGDNHGTAGKAVFDIVKRSVDELIDKTTGIQTLAQMAALVDLVKEFGFVPKDRILDIHGYKKIYNDELLKMVRSREKKFRSGELAETDFTIKNAVLFVERLHRAGIRLYLASGTDLEDVRREAGIMGYDHYFDGGIYGAVGDVNKEAKGIVLEKILSTIGRSAHKNIVTFGDGPVEIRETHKRGGLTVGLASDEVKRFGLNEKKRTRLIKAGADIIIPDFTGMDRILSLLNVK